MQREGNNSGESNYLKRNEEVPFRQMGFKNDRSSNCNTKNLFLDSYSRKETGNQEDVQLILYSLDVFFFQKKEK